MASMTDRVRAVAQSLIVAAGMTNAVATTDILKQAEVVHKQFGEYSKIQIANKISDEIKKSHRPGVSGSL